MFLDYEFLIPQFIQITISIFTAFYSDVEIIDTFIFHWSDKNKNHENTVGIMKTQNKIKFINECNKIFLKWIHYYLSLNV